MSSDNVIFKTFFIFTFNELGAPAEGITSWSGHDDHRICGITIASYDPALLGEDCLTISAEFTLAALGLEMTKCKYLLCNFQFTISQHVGKRIIWTR